MEDTYMMKIKQLTASEFEHFTNTFNIHSLYQTVEYAQTMQRQGFQYLFLGMTEDDQTIVAASLILIQKRDGYHYAYAPRGFLINYNNFDLLKKFTSLLKKFLGKRDIIAIKLNPLIIKNVYDKYHNLKECNDYYDKIYNDLRRLGYYHLGYNHFFESFKPRFEAILNLEYPYYQLFGGMSKQYRTKIRSAEKNGIKIHKGSINNLDYLYLQTKDKYPRDLKFFQDAFQIFGQTQSIEFYYAKLDTTYFLTKTQEAYALSEQRSFDINNQILQGGNEKNAKLIDQKIILDNEANQYKNHLIKATNLLKNFPTGAILASALVIKNKDEIFLFMDGFDANYKSFNGKHLLLWKLIEKYSNEGFKKFNLGGISNPNLENNPYKGLNDFKMNFGADAYEYIGDLELVTNSARYFMYRNSAPIRNMLKH